MLTPGIFHQLTVTAKTADGYTLQHANGELVQLPLALADTGLLKGDTLTVFVFLNEQQQLTATCNAPKGKVGDLLTLKVTSMTPAGAWLDWGLPTPLFLPRSWHEDDLLTGDYCLVKIVFDEASNKVLAKEILTDELSNETLTVRDKEIVECIVYKDTELGYQVIVNGKHLGLLHYNEVFKDLYVGDVFTGFVKKIKEDNKLDIMIGKPGHMRVEDEAGRVISALRKQGGFLPYHDKSSADDIYRVFGMSKKTFKMTIGSLYKERKITIEENGIRLV